MSSQGSPERVQSTDVGARLRVAREDRQISLREIAATTKISVSALEAVEENDVAQLPGGIFTRAFVRAYAAEVGLDPEETMRDFIEQVPADGGEEEKKFDPRAHEHDLFQSQQRMAGTVLKLVLVGLPVAAALLFFGTRAVTTGIIAPEAEPTETVPVPSVSAPVEPTTTPVPVEAVIAERLAIVLHPRADCWVSLTLDGESEPVVSRTMRAGESTSFEADDEMNLIVGDPGAFAFTINQQAGKSFDAGNPVTLHITRQNYRNFVAP
jgi:transcriptional regulator with XRE-family HTH domain